MSGLFWPKCFIFYCQTDDLASVGSYVGLDYFG
jgi:hypothetical protein